MMSVFSWIPSQRRLVLALMLATVTTPCTAADAKKGTAPTKAKAAAKPEKTPVYTTPPTATERLKKAFPRAYAKLSQRQPVHVMVVGDDIANMTGQGNVNGNQLLAWPVRLVNELAQEFYYTGGIRLIRPNPGQPDRLLEAFGPEITVRVLTENGGTMAKAMSILATFAYEEPPDLVIIGFGANDALAGADLMDYAKNLHRVVETIRARGADLWLVGPTLLAGDKPENGLAATRAFAGIVRDEATEAGAAYSDLGDLRSLVRLEPDMLAPTKVLSAIQEQYAQFFAWEGAVDLVHPLPLLHQRLATQAYRDLTTDPVPTPWNLTVAGAAFTGANEFVVTGTVENTTKKELKLTLAPLKLPRWTAKEEPFELTLKAGAKTELRLTYQLTPSPRAPWFPPFPGHEPALRLPLLVASTAATRIEELHAKIQPLAVMWKLDTLYNQDDKFTVDNVVLNTSDGDLRGIAWAAEWNGQRKTGTIDIAKGANATLALTFDLPKGTGPRRIASPLLLVLSVNGITLRSDRAIEINRNFGLQQELPLTLRGNGQGNVELNLTADDKALTFTFDVTGKALEAGPDGTAITAEIHLDARSYGKRLMLGSTEGIVVSAGATDGDAKVNRILPWAFGTGYGMKFDERAVQARITSTLAASSLTVALPRTFLYLHEWALKNGNSQMALNVILRLASAQGGSSPDRTWSLTFNGKHSDDVEGAAVLELTDQPTSRWTVIVW